MATITENVSGSLSDIVREGWNRDLCPQCNSLTQLHQNPKFLAYVEKQLSDMGFRHLEFIGAGSYAMAFYTTENQVVRLSVTDFDQVLKRPKHPAILQPILQKTIRKGSESMFLEVLPRVRITKLLEADNEMLRTALAKSNLQVSDFNNKGNTGYIDIADESLPVLVDAGRVTLRDKDKPIVFDKLVLAPWLDAKGNWKQDIFEQRKTPSGVVDKAKLEQLDTAMRGKRSWRDKIPKFHKMPRDSRRISETIEAIKTDGMYPERVAELYKRAMLKHDDTTNFSEVLRQERALMQDEMKR